MLKIPHASVVLGFEDLLPDANGEIVIVCGGDHPQLSIMTDRKICWEGVAGNHVTAEGIQATGPRYYTFEGGTKLYYSPDIDLTIAPAVA